LLSKGRDRFTIMKIKLSTTTSLLWVAGGFISCVSAKAILGVDLGSLYMKVALVQRGAPLEIVTNFHSKRRTEQMILFDQGTRYYGADASSLLARKPTKTPAGMTVMLGRDEEHPAIKVRHATLHHGLRVTIITSFQWNLTKLFFLFSGSY
jgi:molecular chaperone DnaK (HSP70)